MQANWKTLQWNDMGICVSQTQWLQYRIVQKVGKEPLSTAADGDGEVK